VGQPTGVFKIKVKGEFSITGLLALTFDWSVLYFIIQIYEVICRQMQSPLPPRRPSSPPGQGQKKEGRRPQAKVPNLLPSQLPKLCRKPVAMPESPARASVTF